MTGPFDSLGGQRFGAIMADPPWDFKTRSAKGAGRSPSSHYSTMDLAAIKALPVADLAAKDCWLFLWTTTPHQRMAHEVLDAWGFTFSASAFVWLKLKRSFNPNQLRFLPPGELDLHLSMGFTTRKNVELCLLARRGRPKRLARDVREVIIAPVREHSAKPDEAFRRVERFAAGPHLELFSRRSQPGWAAWGDQVGLLDPATAGPAVINPGEP